MFFAPCFWSSAPLILLTSLVMLALPPQVEETEVEEGKWKEGARGAPRLVAMIPVQSWNTCSSNWSFAIDHYFQMSRRRGEKSGKEDGPAGGGWSSKTLFTPSHDFFIFYKSSAFCKIVIPGKQKLRPAILDEEELAKTGMGAVLNMARCMVGLTCSISSICLICLACSICLICLPLPPCSTS